MRALKALILAAGMLASFAAPAAAQWSFQIDTMSRYIWRGFDLYAPDNAAFQPSVTYTFGESGLSANVWTSFALGDRATYRTDDEIDLTLTYTVPTGEDFGFSVGLIHYGWYFDRGFSFRGSTTQELFLTAGLPRAFLQPTLSVYYDVNLGSGLYANLKIGREIRLSDKLVWNLTAALGYNNRQWISGSGFSDLALGTGLPIKAGPLTVVPLISWTINFLDEVNPHNEILFGLSLIF